MSGRTKRLGDGGIDEPRHIDDRKGCRLVERNPTPLIPLTPLSLDVELGAADVAAFGVTPTLEAKKHFPARAKPRHHLG